MLDFTYHSISEADRDNFCELVNKWIDFTKFEVANVNHNEPHTRFTLSLAPGSELSSKMGPIRKLIFMKFYHFIDNDYHSNAVRYNTKQAMLILKTNDNKMITCGFDMQNLNPDIGLTKKEILAQTTSLMRKVGCHIDNLFKDIGNRFLADWETKFYKSLYLDRAKTFYLKLHPYIGNDIVEFMRCNELSSTSVTLLSFGSGDGEDLQTIKKCLANHQISVSKAIGFELNKNNFHNQSEISSDVVLKQGDVRCAEQLIQETNCDPNTFKVGLFIGILVSRCLKGTYEALNAIQQTRELDFIIVSGTTFVLLNKSMLKAAGFCVNETQLNHDLEMVGEGESSMSVVNGIRLGEVDVKKYFELFWMPDVERHSYLTKRGKSRSHAHQFDTLDLSFSANPLRDIKLFENNNTLEEIKQVDISWSYFRKPEIDQFIEALLKFKADKLIILLSKNQIFYNELVEAFSKHPKFICYKRSDANNRDEVPSIKPREGVEWGGLPKVTC